MKVICLALVCAVGAFASAAAPAGAPDLAALCADRLATEKVYYEHRLGTKPPFSQAMPPERVSVLVKSDLKKEAVLRRAYGVSVTEQLVQAEVERIHQTTRAPEVLLQLQQALGNDPLRFARTVARPIVVERLLRQRFDNDDALHVSQRRAATHLREQVLQAKRDGASLEKLVALLAGSHPGSFSEITWQLGPHAADSKAKVWPPLPAAGSNAPVTSSGGPFVVQASVQPAQPLLPSERGASNSRCSFDELPPELQQVLRAQLRQAGDVSAVIELPSTFVVYVLKHRSNAELAVAGLFLAKRSFDDWLASQPEP